MHIQIYTMRAADGVNQVTCLAVKGSADMQGGLEFLNGGAGRYARTGFALGAVARKGSRGVGG